MCRVRAESWNAAHAARTGLVAAARCGGDVRLAWPEEPPSWSLEDLAILRAKRGQTRGASLLLLLSAEAGPPGSWASSPLCIPALLRLLSSHLD